MWKSDRLCGVFSCRCCSIRVRSRAEALQLGPHSAREARLRWQRLGPGTAAGAQQQHGPSAAFGLACMATEPCPTSGQWQLAQHHRLSCDYREGRVLEVVEDTAVGPPRTWPPLSGWGLTAWAPGRLAVQRALLSPSGCCQ